MTCSDERRVVRAHLAYKLVLYGCGLIIGAALLFLLNEPFSLVMDTANQQTTSQAATNGQSYMDTIWAALPLVVLAYGGFAIVVRAYTERSGGV